MKPEIPAERMHLLLMPPHEGVTEEQAVDARKAFGSNLIAEHKSRSGVEIARDTAGDPMLWFLLLTSGLFALLGEFADAAILLAAIVPLLGMDFYLHRRTQASIEGLTDVLAAEATVLRDGRRLVIPASGIVAGDLVIVSAGESFPADGIIVTGNELQAEESSLTGEAFPVTKRAHEGPRTPQEESWAFAGTRLLTGSAHVRVLLVGTDTLYGEVVRSVVQGPQERTPLQDSVAGLVKLLLIAAIILCLILAAVRLWQGFGWIDAFLSAATLAVAAIPEEFPVVLTFFLGVGVFRLAKQHALVRRAVAVENIGRVSAICSDKTGTITEGRLSFSAAWPNAGMTSEDLLRIAGLASREDSGDPLDLAILTQAPSTPQDWTRTRIFPFTEGRRRESSFWQRPDEAGILAVKGAPETILSLCEISDDEKGRWLETVRARSAEGSKVIACAWLNLDKEPDEEPSSRLKFAGLIGVTDPVREGVREAMAKAREAGIQVVMVTGDHAQTAVAIAKEAGLADAPVPIEGDDFEARINDLSEEDLHQLTVVARANPAQKVQVVRALQSSGRIVAVTGDGVNDAPALRAADVGIAMGIRGTRTAREVSQIVLMDDNFRTIVAAVAEGRQLFQNLRMSFAFLLMVHIPLVTTAAIIPLLGFPLLYLPVHIVWLELLIHPAAILGFQKAADGRHATQRPTSRNFFDAYEWTIVALTGGAITIAVLGIFIATMSSGETSQHARTMAVTTLVASLALLLPVLSRGATITGWLVALCAGASAYAFARINGLASLMHMHPLPFGQWATAFILGALPALGASFLWRKRRRRR